ncbi:MAG TPA: nucleotide exchange factor GrpE [Planctomycetota bacterium]|nr:nucleotide exchange factor GrpE [Planctomycetota bacterium]
MDTPDKPETAEPERIPTPEPPCSPEELARLREEVERLRAQAAKSREYLDLARRIKADFANYQDRIQRERAAWTREAVEDFIRDFLPALDAFTWARFEEPTLMESLRLVEHEFLRVLAKHGIFPLETEGSTFNPLFHEAVAFEETDLQPDGTILEEVRRGWSLEGHVLRPTSVRIARPKSKTQTGSPREEGPDAGQAPEPGEGSDHAV